MVVFIICIAVVHRSSSYGPGVWSLYKQRTNLIFTVKQSQSGTLQVL